jgi:fatty-acyl-CoA synthase
MTLALVAADKSLTFEKWSVGDLLKHAAASAPDTLALNEIDWAGAEVRHWTYAQLRADSRRLAAFLLTQFRQGEHVAIWAANSAQWVLYQLAMAQAGLVMVTLNPALRAPEIDALLRQSRSVGLILDPAYRETNMLTIAETLRTDLPLIRSVLRTDEWQLHLAAAAAAAPAIEVAPTDPAMLLYTSGTTGKPKGVVLRHCGIVNNAIMGSERYGLSGPTAWLGVLPLFHVGGSVTSVLGCIARLGRNVAVPGFEAALILRVIEEQRIGWFPVVPPMVISMIEHEQFAHTNLSSLKLVLTGGTTITPDFVRLVRQKFLVDVQVMFGQTEAGGGMTKTYRSDTIETITSTVGRPYPHTTMRIADVLTGATLNAGDTGEIRIQSPFMTDGYFDNPGATEAAFDDQGFLRTGDLGTLDEHGYLRVTGRLKEMIIRGGENIYPREIEDALGEFPGIVEAVVVGVPHARWGEEVAVAIRCAANQSIEVDAVRDFLLGRLARHKVPKLWKLVEEFPRTASGKIQKFEVVGWFSNGG